MSKLLTKAEMQKLTTRRLLAYKNALLKNFREGPSWTFAGDNPKKEITKICDDWIKTYTTCKAVLATREHVQRKSK